MLHRLEFRAMGSDVLAVVDAVARPLLQVWLEAQPELAGVFILEIGQQVHTQNQEQYTRNNSPIRS